MEYTKIKVQDVLFQKLGTKWYLFTESDDGVSFFDLPKGFDPRENSVDLYEVINTAKAKKGSKQGQLENRL